MDEAAPDTAQPAPQRPGPAVLPGPLDFRPGPRLESTAYVADDAVALGLASAKVYTFLSIDYPGAAHSEIWDFNGGAGDAVGMFAFDPGADGAIGTGDANPGGADASTAVAALRPRPRRGQGPGSRSPSPGITRFSPSRIRPRASLRAPTRTVGSSGCTWIWTVCDAAL